VKIEAIVLIALLRRHSMKHKVLFVAVFVLLATAFGVAMVAAQGSQSDDPHAPNANAGTAFTYQGQLKNNGTPVNGSCNLAFGLWAAASSGNQIGTNITQTLPITNGLFTTQLDFGANAFTGDARWLQIAVRCPAGTGSFTPLTSRQPLTPAPLALALPGLYTRQNATSPNVIGGYNGNTISPGVVGATIGGGGYAGFVNQILADYSAIGGGNANQTSGVGDTISGGAGNVVSGTLATVGGGFYNTASADYATVGGGNHNTADDSGSFVGGGDHNTASLDYATVDGGNSNTASASYATVGGGSANISNGYAATVGGGENNTASGEDAAVGGGIKNIADGIGAFVGGGGYDGNGISGNRASGIVATVGGGYGNNVTVTGTYGFIGGGYGNIASGNTVVIAGGDTNIAQNNYATVGGGYFNKATGLASVVSGGSNNEAGNNYDTVGGGFSNHATGTSSVVGGGWGNTASGGGATVAGGSANTAAGDYSFAAGFRAKANADGNFTFADSSPFDFTSAMTNSFRVRATGGVRFVLGIDGTGATTWSCVVVNGGSWSCSSDRNLKENFVAVDSRTTLERLSQVPILQWNAKGTDPNVKHFGPMAQDFYAAFGLGENNKSIDTIDLDGVALSSIQGLYTMAKQQDAEVASLKSENDAQQKKIDDLESRLAALEQSIQTNNTGSHTDNQENMAMLIIGALLGVVLIRQPWRGGIR
jgi:hypothetical protein